MKVILEYSAMLDVKGHVSGDNFECAEGTTIKDILGALKIRREHQRFVIATVNNTEVRHSHVVIEKDKLFFLVMAGGG